MSFEKKTVYHSGLVAEGRISVLILSEPKKSKFKKDGKDQFYIEFKYDGNEHHYIIENSSVHKKLAGLKGHVVEIEASGSREEADVQVFDAAGPGSAASNQQRSQQPPPAAGAPPSTGDTVKDAKVMLLQHINARVLAMDAAAETDRRWQERGNDCLTEEQWASAVNCYYISIDRAGVIAVLPWKEIPPHTAPAKQPEPPRREPEPPPRRDEPPAPDDDEIPF